MALERLDKLLASTGRWSRKEVKDLIPAGQGPVRRPSALRPEEKWDPEEAELTVDGQRVDCAPSSTSCSTSWRACCPPRRDRDQRTVLDLLPEHLRRRGLFPVGRLDKDTEGLLLLTDNARWGTRCSRPSAMWIRYIWPMWTAWWIRAT